jgi:hypothetical protein
MAVSREEEMAARLRRQMEWDEEYRERPAPQWPEETDAWPPTWPEQGLSPDPAPYPAGLGDIPPQSSQPAAVLLAWQLGRRGTDPLTKYEEARAMRADRVAERELEAGTVRLDGREALRRMAVSRNPDGGNLSGSRALDLIRQLGVGGVGHEPGARP